MGRRGRLKIAWPLAVQVRVLPRAPLVASDDRRIAGSDVQRRRRATIFTDLVGFQQFLQCVAIEQCRALVAELRELQLEAVDLARLSEDLTDAQTSARRHASTISSRRDSRIRWARISLGRSGSESSSASSAQPCRRTPGDLVRAVRLHRVQAYQDPTAQAFRFRPGLQAQFSVVRRPASSMKSSKRGEVLGDATEELDADARFAVALVGRHHALRPRDAADRLERSAVRAAGARPGDAGRESAARSSARRLRPARRWRRSPARRERTGVPSTGRAPARSSRCARAATPGSSDAGVGC